MSSHSSNDEPVSCDQTREHPLFDERSHYRTATSLSIWMDGGHARFRDFFDRWHWELATHLRRRTVQHEWNEDALDESQQIKKVPPHPAWSGTLNEAMVEGFELDLRGPVVGRATDIQTTGQSGERQRGLASPAMAAGAAYLEPVLWTTVVDPQSEATDELPTPVLELLRDSAAGAAITGLTEQGTPQPEGKQVPPPLGPISHHFEVSISLGGRSQGAGDYGLHGHRAMFLVLRSSHVNRLKFLLELPLNENEFRPVGVQPPRFGRPEEPVRDMSEVRDVLFEALDPKNLLPEDQDGPQRRRARWLQATLAHAPAIEATLPDDGRDLRFYEKIDLGHDLATLRTRQELEEIELVERFYDDEDEDDFDLVNSDGVPIQSGNASGTDVAPALSDNADSEKSRKKHEESKTAPSFFVPLLVLGPKPVQLP